MAVLLRVEALVLDMDDTINRTTEAMYGALGTAASTLWPALSEQDRAAAVDHYVRDEAGWFPRFSTGALDYGGMRRGRLGAMARAIGVAELDDENFTRFETTYRAAFVAGCCAWDDALRLIDRAEEAGIPVAVLSNSTEFMTRKKVNRLGIADLFTAVLTCDQLGAGKPDPNAYRAACEALDCAPDKVGYVDDLRRDALGATAAGLQSVWLDRLGIGDQVSCGQLSGGKDAFAARVTSLDEIDLEMLAGR
ncbi:HAD family hydrolase [Propionibacterium sp.]|uniref:HAD family hydrolase n=1 Tax=Propionibacterium sp. TaxID=1977903 RepID=UPI0039EC82C5